MFLLIFFLDLAYQSPVFNATKQNQFYESQMNLTLSFYTETAFVYPDENTESQNRLFYHLFLKTGTKELNEVSQFDKLVFWIGGEAICSAQQGNFEQIGPIIINNSLYLREYSWNRDAHLVFVDQPFNVGFSRSTKSNLVNNSQTASEYFVKFLKEFFLHRNQLSQLQFYVIGDGYSGHIIPNIASNLLKTNSYPNFAGIILGSPWVFPFTQSAYFGSYLYSSGLLDDGLCDQNRQISTQSQINLLNRKLNESTDTINQLLNSETGGMNTYNILQQNQSDRVPAYINFLQNKRSNFSEIDQEFIECNEDVKKLFKEDISKDYENKLVEVLSRIKVLIYNGQLDYVNNSPGTLTWINQLKWDNIDDWKQQKKVLLQTVENSTTISQGYYKKYMNLYYAIIYRAGHYVPTDNPQAAQLMFNKFINDLM
ncbi:hypothetical protein pb186bvf_019697 [Paramecium bursaria]